MEWSWYASPLQAAAVTAGAMLLAAIGLFALLRRGQWLTTLLFSSAFLSLAAFEAGTLGMVDADSAASARAWAAYLARNSALVSWLWLTLSVVLGRPDARQQLRAAGAYLVLSLLGCAILWGMAGTPLVVRQVVGLGPPALVVFGGIGKLYLIYLVVAMVVVLMNLESMLRTASSSGQKRLRPMFLAILTAILTQLLVVSAGLLYGGLRVSWMVTSAPVLFVAGSIAAMALARRRLSDMSVPVARPVIYYSSVSLTLAGAFMLGVLVLSRLVPVLSQTWRFGVVLAFVVFVGGGGLLLMLSPSTSRSIRRFIDRNFYANRFDYRREWERVTSALTPTARPDEVARQVETLVTTIFDAGRVAIHLRDESGGPFRLLLGPPEASAVLVPEHALVRHLTERQLPVVFHDLEKDIDLIPIVVESEPTIASIGAAVCAPLAVGDDVVGLLWLSCKRNDDEWSFEDVEFLSAMTRQLAAALWFSRQTEVLVETRQVDSLNRLSSFVLHDIKNLISGLSLVVENAHRHMGNPEFQRDAMAVVERTVRSLRELMSQVSGVSRGLQLQPVPCSLRDIVDEALTASGLTLGDAAGVRIRVQLRETGEVTVDRALMTRVLMNLLTNAREAVVPGGEIAVDGEVTRDGSEQPQLILSVSDDGRGMSEEFVRSRLFRPFSTTKPSGLGIGLAQCRTIVEAHGGRIEVKSRVGAGSTFTLRMPATVFGSAPEPAVGAAGGSPHGDPT